MTIVTENFINHEKIAGLRFHFVMPHLTWHHNFTLKDRRNIFEKKSSEELFEQMLFTLVRPLDLWWFSPCLGTPVPRVLCRAPYCLRVVSKSLKSNDDEACKLGVNRPHSLHKLLHIVIKWPWRSFFSHWAVTIRPGQYNIITSYNNNLIQNHSLLHALSSPLAYSPASSTFIWGGNIIKKHIKCGLLSGILFLTPNNRPFCF